MSDAAEVRVDSRDWDTLPAPGVYTVVVEHEKDGCVVMRWRLLYLTAPKEVARG